MEYCSTIPPLQQLNEGVPQPPTVMVPVSVLKREGSTKQRVDSQKSVMFSDGMIIKKLIYFLSFFFSLSILFFYYLLNLIIYFLYYL